MTDNAVILNVLSRSAVLTISAIQRLFSVT